MRTYKNATLDDVWMVWESDQENETVRVPAGAVLSFDEAADNGPDIDAMCIDAGLVRVT